MPKRKTRKQEIAFQKLEPGRWNPVETECLYIRTNGSAEGKKVTIVTFDGRTVSGWLTTIDFSDENGRESHFAFCKQADQHRGRANENHN